MLDSGVFLEGKSLSSNAVTLQNTRRLTSRTAVTSWKDALPDLLKLKGPGTRSIAPARYAFAPVPPPMGGHAAITRYRNHTVEPEKLR